MRVSTGSTFTQAIYEESVRRLRERLVATGLVVEAEFSRTGDTTAIACAKLVAVLQEILDWLDAEPTGSIDGG